MLRGRVWSRSAATVILLIAAFEIFGCALCSDETCGLRGTLSHQSHQERPSGDDCLCCCGHLLVKSVIHVEPVAIVSPVREPTPTSALLESHSSLYHPPRALSA